MPEKRKEIKWVEVRWQKFPDMDALIRVHNHSNYEYEVHTFIYFNKEDNTFWKYVGSEDGRHYYRGEFPK